MSAALQSPSGRISLETTPIMIGYTADGRVVVNDAQATSVAAIITASGQGHTITAPNSAYQVTLNGQPLGQQQAHWLHPNDTITIGETKLTYVESQTAPYTPIPPAPAETNPYGYEEIEDVDKTLIRKPAEVAREIQACTAQQVATGPQAPIEQRPFTPPPINVGSGGPWPQYQGVSSDPYSSPPPTPTPASTPASQPFTGPQQVLPASMGSPAVGPQSKAPVLPSWLLQEGKPDPLKLLLIGLVVLLVLVAAVSGTLIYQVTRPQPVVVLNSQYMQGNTAVGSTGTSLHVLGYKFSGNTPITFLLDNQTVTGAPNVHSDGSGNFQADLPITTAWPVGMHKLTAKDSGGYLSTNVSNVLIVNQGQAGTTGPNGAPPDNGSFALKVTLASSNISETPITNILTVKGNSSGSATVCNDYSDNNQQFPTSGSLQDGTTYKGTNTFTCQGTYQAGKLSYTEMISQQLTLSDGASCQTASSIILIQLNGSFSTTTTASGTYSIPGYQAPCTGGKRNSINFSGETGNWTGTLS